MHSFDARMAFISASPTVFCTIIKRYTNVLMRNQQAEGSNFPIITIAECASNLIFGYAAWIIPPVAQSLFPSEHTWLPERRGESMICLLRNAFKFLALRRLDQMICWTDF